MTLRVTVNELKCQSYRRCTAVAPAVFGISAYETDGAGLKNGATVLLVNRGVAAMGIDLGGLPPAIPPFLSDQGGKPTGRL